MKTKEQFYKGITIGFDELKYQHEQENNGNGTTFSFRKFNVLNVDYVAIKRDPQGWKGKRGATYEIVDMMGNQVLGFYNKVKSQNIRYCSNVKNIKELIYKFTTIAENSDYIIRDTHYLECNIQ